MNEFVFSFIYFVMIMGGRAAWKGPFFQMSLLNAIRQDTAGLGVQTKSRSSTIIPAMVGALLHIHNGHDYMPVRIREEMVGLKVGQLAATRKPWSFRATNAHKRIK